MNGYQQKAFSLVELLVVLTLVAVMLNLGAPAFKTLVETNRSQAIHDQLKASLHLARTHSISHGKRVELCGSSQGSRCDHNWQKGWIIREQSSSKPIQTVSLSQKEQLIWRGFSRPIRFQPTGFSGHSNGTFTFCGQDAKPKWQIILNRQGRPRTAKADQLRVSACEKVDRPS